MISVKADLHIHTFLSPCGDIEMTPRHIVEAALGKGVQMIAITDHNSTLQAPVIQELGAGLGLEVICGAEITTKEEVHCLALVETPGQRQELQSFLDTYLPHIENNPEKFGYQFWIDTNEQVLGEAPWLLISALDRTIEQVEAFVHSIGGIFIPAHINKMRDSVISQLGFLPPDLKVDALELSRHITPQAFITSNPYLKDYFFIRSSDAHFIQDVGSVFTEIQMETIDFHGLRNAFTRQ
ncbi:MAG: PHP domain-containing protein [Bacteroidales bacterium]|jgi:PHP family Zn ribbon phosphoesterase